MPYAASPADDPTDRIPEMSASFVAVPGTAGQTSYETANRRGVAPDNRLFDTAGCRWYQDSVVLWHLALLPFAIKPNWGKDDEFIFFSNI